MNQDHCPQDERPRNQTETGKGGISRSTDLAVASIMLPHNNI
jgi:hypothetical protein